jgi:hypothetical protein
VTQLFNSLTSVKSAADLLICLNEPLQLAGQVSVLANQHVTMVLKSVDF